MASLEIMIDIVLTTQGTANALFHCRGFMSKLDLQHFVWPGFSLYGILDGKSIIYL